MKVTSIVGSMFSGKSTLLLKKIREAKRVPSFYVLVFKPQIDDRFGVTKVVTHDQEGTDCISVPSAAPILSFFYQVKQENPEKKIIVFIDESQFFDSEIIQVVQELMREGAEVVCAGLNIDRFGQPFGYMPHLMAISDEIILLKTKCKCGNDSYVSFSHEESSEQVLVGADQYEPLCKECWLKRS